MQSPTPPPIYQEVEQHVQAPPPHWAVPNKVVIDGPVIKEDYRVIRRAETTVRTNSPVHVPARTYTQPVSKKAINFIKAITTPKKLASPKTIKAPTTKDKDP